MQSLRKIELRAPAVGAKIWCLSVTIWSAGALFVRVGHNLNRHCVAIYRSILILFSRFLSEGIVFRLSVTYNGLYRVLANEWRSIMQQFNGGCLKEIECVAFSY